MTHGTRMTHAAALRALTLAASDRVEDAETDADSDAAYRVLAALRAQVRAMTSP